MKTLCEYVRNHLSALLLCGMIFMGVLMLIGGSYLKTFSETELGAWEYSAKVLIEVFTQLGVALIIMAATLIFFNLEDVRNTMSKGVISLFVEGDVVRFFSPETKERLRRVLALDKVAPAIESIPSDLYEFLADVEREILVKPTASSMRWNKTISKDNKNETNLYKYETAISFDLSADHAAQKKLKHDFSFAEESTFSNPPPFTLDEWFEKLEVLIGGDRFDLQSKEVSKTKRQSGGQWIYKLEFRIHIDINKK